MRKMYLTNKGGLSFAIDTLLDSREIVEIEFKLGIDDCESANEMEDYILQLENDGKLMTHYIKYETHKNGWLFYFRDSMDNRYYLYVEKE